MKKAICIILSVFLIVSLFSGCKNNTDNNSNQKLNIVTTIFPLYDWTREILGEKIKDVNFTFLLDNGVDPHSFQPSTKDIVTVSSCDLLIYVGGESDKWIDDSLKESINNKFTKVKLMDNKNTVLEEETVEGMQKSEEKEESEYDEHIWLSIKNAKKYCNIISENLSLLDSANAEYYKANTDNYISKLDELDKEYENAVASAKNRTLIFADRFPFRYLTNDYDIKYFAAFDGCSAESEASFETISFLSNKLDELNVPLIVLEESDKKIAKTVISAAKYKDTIILTLDSMQTITKEEYNSGKTYLEIAKTNLESLKKALL